MAVSREDVDIAVLTASTALAGLVLVFLGIVAGAVASYSGGTPPAVLAAARRPGWAVLGSFGIGWACATCATIWLLDPKSFSLYVITVVLFFAQLTSLAVVAVWVGLQALRG